MHSAPIVCTSVLFIHISIVFLFRFLALKSFSPDVVIQFVYHVLSVPGSMFHLYCSSPNVSKFFIISTLDMYVCTVGSKDY